jgi:hypothetical protein
MFNLRSSTRGNYPLLLSSCKRFTGCQFSGFKHLLAVNSLNVNQALPILVTGSLWRHASQLSAPMHAMKASEGVEVLLQSFVISALDDGGQLHTSTALLRRKSPRYQMNLWLNVSQDRTERFRDEKNPLSLAEN